ncbi:MAG: hypothetical protein WCT31_02340 [Candidatus Micrarchaeia archaeon]|jgi:hypothetical protein
MKKPAVGGGLQAGIGIGRMVARTFSIEEAQRIRETYESQGYDAEIIENKQGNMRIYEVYVKKEKEGFFAPPRTLRTD